MRGRVQAAPEFRPDVAHLGVAAGYRVTGSGLGLRGALSANAGRAVSDDGAIVDIRAVGYARGKTGWSGVFDAAVPFISPIGLAWAG